MTESPEVSDAADDQFHAVGSHDSNNDSAQSDLSADDVSDLQIGIERPA